MLESGERLWSAAGDERVRDSRSGAGKRAG
jgi:hypothetical protein